MNDAATMSGSEVLGTGARSARVAELSVRTAPAVCRAVEARLAAGASCIALDLGDAERVDAVGLATLMAAVARVSQAGARLVVRPSVAVRHALLQARLLDAVPLDGAADGPDAVVALPDVRGDDPGIAFVAHTARVGLRLPPTDAVDQFARWGDDALLDQMVGSELLYRCRQRGLDAGEAQRLIQHDPTAVTLLVEGLHPPFGTLGFVRLYGIDLVQRFGFLEIAMPGVEAVRKGRGLEAARLFVAWAHDVLGLARVEAKVYDYNVLSANALRRNGFQQEAVLRSARVYDGKRWDILVFSLLEAEMAAQRQRECFPYLGFWSQPQ
jgi:RimJ/RimL family protein N-acetyltransferase/anti-anti-sigma regulatory factor